MTRSSCASVCALLVACSEGGLGSTERMPSEGDAGGHAADAGSPADAAPAEVDAAGCASLDLVAETLRRPVDVVIWVDDGGSFGSARGKVARSIQMNLTAILEAAGVDYHVVLLSSGTAVGEPLASSGRFFRAPGGYSGGGGGFAFFSSPTLLARYVDLLRPEAFKVLLSATDCEHEAGTDFAGFEAELIANAPEQFTGGADRNFAYHMIGNVALRAPETLPWDPASPVAGRGSYSDFTACTRVQGGAIATGGYRLGVAATTYDDLFEHIAAAGVAESRLPCSFTPPPGDLDLERVRFRYQPGDGSMEHAYRQVDDATACGAAGGFYEAAGTLELCPTTCDLVRADPAAAVHFTFECALL